MNTMGARTAFHKTGLDKIIKLYRNDQPSWYPELLGEEISDKQRFYRIHTEGDLGYAVTVNEGGSATFDEFQTPYTMDITPLKRQIGWLSTTEALEGDIYGVVKRAVPKLERSLRKTMELAVANQINNMTSTSTPYVCPDGLALISTAHLYQGGTWANRPSSDLAFGYLALEQALQELRDQVSHRGIPDPQVGPFTLIVPNELEGVANRVVSSMQIPQSANNDPNWAKRRINNIHVNPFLTDANNWALQTTAKDQRSICLVRRRGITMRQEYDIYKDAEVYSVNEIYQLFNKDARGFWGTAPS